VHPHEAKDGVNGLAELLAAPEVVAVGECGLDYYYDHSPRDVQWEVFAAQIRLSHELGLPLVIHTREAWDDTFAVLDEERVPDRTVFHCFSGGIREARRALDTGAFLSFAGVLTFPSAGDIREAVGICPLERLLVETDSPYLAPVPHRGKPNRPGLVPVVGAAVAEIKGLAPEAVAEATWKTAETVFGL
jgi:TatD DNase family protein